MARSRRPELEKDNPVAPEVYSRRRRKAASGDHWHPSEALETLQALMEAAESYVNRTPRLKRTEAERRALLDVITRAQLLLSVKHLSETVQ